MSVSMKNNIDQYVPGQRWASEMEPELGLGTLDVRIKWHVDFLKQDKSRKVLQLQKRRVVTWGKN